jgi:hypothetical protein
MDLLRASAGITKPSNIIRLSKGVQLPNAESGVNYNFLAALWS